MVHQLRGAIVSERPPEPIGEKQTWRAKVRETAAAGRGGRERIFARRPDDGADLVAEMDVDGRPLTLRSRPPPFERPKGW